MSCAGEERSYHQPRQLAGLPVTRTQPEASRSCGLSVWTRTATKSQERRMWSWPTGGRRPRRRFDEAIRARIDGADGAGKSDVVSARRPEAGRCPGEAPAGEGDQQGITDTMRTDDDADGREALLGRAGVRGG